MVATTCLSTKAGVSPILADEMGLGKTVQTIALLAVLRSADRSAVVGGRARLEGEFLVCHHTSTYQCSLT